MNIVVYVVLMFSAFFIGVWAYRKGLQDGLAINKGKDIKPIPNPITSTYKAVTEVKEQVKQKKDETDFMENINNLFAYDGTPQKRSDD